ncbi:hypothetical protein [Streptomyces sp. NPDC101455]|uniref:hypothetical protein n=1 Tax=Streptomyces sp. NPDC101455 TaxID=3366142 RepID=UPI00381E7542
MTEVRKMNTIGPMKAQARPTAMACSAIQIRVLRRPARPRAARWGEARWGEAARVCRAGAGA